jgi:hypothetical protein
VKIATTLNALLAQLSTIKEKLGSNRAMPVNTVARDELKVVRHQQRGAMAAASESSIYLSTCGRLDPSAKMTVACAQKIVDQNGK